MYINTAIQNIKTRWLIGVFATVLFVSLFSQVSLVRAEGVASLSFAPASAEVKAGRDLAIKVHLNTGGEAVNVVQADVVYPLNIFDPGKSKVSCNAPFPTTAQHVVNSTIELDGTTKGMVKVACAIAVTNNASSGPFNGEADIATITLRARASAPATHDTSMLRYVTDVDPVDSRNNYSGVARASDSANILGDVSPADISVLAKENGFSAADINNDNNVNVYDLSILLSNFGKNVANVSDSNADINGDDVVNTTDLSILLSY